MNLGNGGVCLVVTRSAICISIRVFPIVTHSQRISAGRSRSPTFRCVPLLAPHLQVERLRAGSFCVRIALLCDQTARFSRRVHQSGNYPTTQPCSPSHPQIHSKNGGSRRSRVTLLHRPFQFPFQRCHIMRCGKQKCFRLSTRGTSLREALMPMRKHARRSAGY